MLQRQLLILQDLNKVNNLLHISSIIAEYLFAYVKIIMCMCMNVCGAGHFKKS